MYSNGRNLGAGDSEIKREKTVIGYEDSFTLQKKPELTEHQFLHKYWTVQNTARSEYRVGYGDRKWR